ncbi:hbdH1 [Symbiodinium sp. CCMP2592]|nr:hbdH1 [Symbiodinium sp. CCMP2592]
MFVQISALTSFVWVAAPIIALQCFIAAVHRHCQTLKETGRLTLGTACRASKVASLFIFFPWKYSHFGLYRRQSSASCFYSFSYILRVACIVVLIQAFASTPEVVSSPADDSKLNCTGLLKNLTRKKKPKGHTVLDDGKQRLTYLVSCQLPVVVATASLFQSLPVGAFLLSVAGKFITEAKTMFRHCDWCSAKTDRSLRAEISRKARDIRDSMAAGTLEPSWKDRKLLDLELVLLLLDLVSDLNCITQFALASRWGWAAAQSAVFLLSLAFELHAASASSLVAAVLESRKCGYPTDEYLIFVRTEKTIEAPFSLLLQYYATFYVLDPLLFLSACVSMVLSSFSVAKGAYEQLHLALDEAVDQAEELVDRQNLARSQGAMCDKPPIQVEPVGRHYLDRE